MEEVQAAMTAHLDQVSGLVQALSEELRRGIGPAADSLLGFVRAVDWTVPPIPNFFSSPPTVFSSSGTNNPRASRFQEPWLMGVMAFHASLLLATIGLRRNANLQFFLLFLAYSGVYLAQKMNIYLAEHWKSFASRNYFDPAGVFISVVWSGPLIFTSIVTVVSSLITLCQLMVKWKRAELRHRVRLARDKQE
ncbi:unnamed protein product [Alopecurus aequalis]